MLALGLRAIILAKNKDHGVPAGSWLRRKDLALGVKDASLRSAGHFARKVATSVQLTEYQGVSGRLGSKYQFDSHRGLIPLCNFQIPN